MHCVPPIYNRSKLAKPRELGVVCVTEFLVFVGLKGFHSTLLERRNPMYQPLSTKSPKCKSKRSTNDL